MGEKMLKIVNIKNEQHAYHIVYWALKKFPYLEPEDCKLSPYRRSEEMRIRLNGQVNFD